MDNAENFGASAACRIPFSGSDRQTGAEFKSSLSPHDINFGGLKDAASMSISHPDAPDFETIRAEAIGNDAVFLDCRSQLDLSAGAVALMRSRALVAQFPSEELAEAAAWERFPDGAFSIHVIDEAPRPVSLSALR